MRLNIKYEIKGILAKPELQKCLETRNSVKREAGDASLKPRVSFHQMLVPTYFYFFNMVEFSFSVESRFCC